MRILIKGAGDLATGIASRLYGAGHEIMMTEIPVPLTVRRTVALSRAVYERDVLVEEMRGRLAENRETAERIMADGDVAVMVDPDASSAVWYRPDVIVDAILAKKNLGTKINDAPFVVGVGPGFTAGLDCNCVIETKRGHTLGNIIWDGRAIPNTGIPGNVGGYTTERLLRAASDGIINPVVSIGDYVEKGQITAFTGEKPVYAQMSGIVRGMLQPGVKVREGLKIGDIDARAERLHCETISDKARAIGGAVLEAVTGFERMRGQFGIIALAAGAGKRFGGKKLETFIDGKPMYGLMLDKFQAFGSFPAYIVTGSEKIAGAAEERGVKIVWNDEPERGIAYSLHRGLETLLEQHPKIQGAMFCVCDQPDLKAATIQKIFCAASRHPESIVCAGCGEEKGNPVLWNKRFFSELLELEGDQGGRQLMNRYQECVRIIQTGAGELRDVDRKEDLSEPKV